LRTVSRLPVTVSLLLLTAMVMGFAVTVLVFAGVTSVGVIGLVAMVVMIVGISVVAVMGGDA